jgi:hypothetical protein
MARDTFLRWTAMYQNAPATAPRRAQATWMEVVRWTCGGPPRLWHEDALDSYSLPWTEGDMSPISSRKMVPWSAV